MSWEHFKTTIEVINLITAGPVLASIGLWGLKQIKISKDVANTATKREAYKIAAEQCNIFAEKIIPLMADFEKELINGNIKFFDKFDIEIETNKIYITPKEKISEKDLQKIHNSKNLTRLLNSLEGFAMYFCSGVADEKIAYNSTGRAYCEIVHILIPVLLPEFKDDLYRNTSKLFLYWTSKNKRRELIIQKNEIEEKLNKKQEIKIDTFGLENQTL